jgi:hypothetical protein
MQQERGPPHSVPFFYLRTSAHSPFSERRERKRGAPWSVVRRLTRHQPDQVQHRNHPRDRAFGLEASTPRGNGQSRCGERAETASAHCGVNDAKQSGRSAELKPLNGEPRLERNGVRQCGTRQACCTWTLGKPCFQLFQSSNWSLNKGIPNFQQGGRFRNPVKNISRNAWSSPAL